jgi:hypothetical protein
MQLTPADTDKEKSSCCGPTVRKTISSWKACDYYGAALCRISDKFRMRYRVAVGLYSIGSPSPHSPVFVTANYKLSFDHVRKGLGAIDAWILVLDTKGINVWCAAGKGTFGTEELVRRIGSEKVSVKVSHKTLIVPQLGAPGVAAHEVKKRTGFSVVYGPVRSKDLREFIANNNAITPAMRTVTFTLTERMVLVPIEVLAIAKKSIIPLIATALIMGLQKQGILFHQMWVLTAPIILALCAAIVSGCILHPLLLPLMRVRSFALQGIILGLVVGVLLHLSGLISQSSIYAQAALYLLIASLSSYCAFNFTGSTPIANKSGVKKELKIAVPLYIAAAAITAILLIVYKISQEGIL